MHPGNVSWLDLVLVLMLVSSIAFGFQQGLLRQGFLMLSMYIATVLSAQYHGHLASLLQVLFPASAEMTRLMAFVALMVACTLVVTGLIWTAYRQTRLPDVVILDTFGGAALGGLIGVLAISLSLVLTRYALAAPWPEGSVVRQFIQTGLTNSSLQWAFGTPLPLIRAALLPWLPDGIPLVLDG